MSKCAGSIELLTVIEAKKTAQPHWKRFVKKKDDEDAEKRRTFSTKKALKLCIRGLKHPRNTLRQRRGSRVIVKNAGSKVTRRLIVAVVVVMKRAVAAAVTETRMCSATGATRRAIMPETTRTRKRTSADFLWHDDLPGST
jgi:hypothetical protein